MSNPSDLGIVTRAVIVLAGSLAVALQATWSKGPPSAETTVARANFNADGSVNLPQKYRQWWHVGTRLNPTGSTSILDRKPIATPEILNAYVEPAALARFLKTGRWPDGTQIVKEFTQVQTGPGCDPQTFVCHKPLGRAIFESSFNGLGMMVKDAKRYPNAAGHWGYFEFGHHSLPYDQTSPLRPQAQCAACHIARASGADYVFSFAHVGLSALASHDSP